MEAEGAIEGAARLTEADFLEASAHLPAFRRTRTYGLLVAPMWLVVAGTSSLGATRMSDLVPPLLLSGTFTFGVAFWLLRLAPSSWAKRASADTGFGKIDFRLDAQGLSVFSTLRQSQLAWPSLSGYAESVNSFIVHTSPQTIFVIPKRAFDEAELGRVRQMFAERLSPQHGSRRLFLRLALGGIVTVAFLTIWHMLSLEAPR